MVAACYTSSAIERECRVVKIPRLREFRERSLLTQAELAERSGLSEATINRVEKGRHEPRISTARKLAAALGIPPAEFIGPAQQEDSDG